MEVGFGQCGVVFEDDCHGISQRLFLGRFQFLSCQVVEEIVQAGFGQDVLVGLLKYILLEEWHFQIENINS